jgi:hypothetical protein
MGIASVDHQVAINHIMPAAAQASADIPPGGGMIRHAKKPAKPTTNPIT